MIFNTNTQQVNAFGFILLLPFLLTYYRDANHMPSTHTTTHPYNLSKVNEIDREGNNVQ